jgi:hypothetical protein
MFYCATYLFNSSCAAWMCLLYRNLSCSWTCLLYSSLCCGCPSTCLLYSSLIVLARSCLHCLQQLVLHLDCLSAIACSAPVHVLLYCTLRACLSKRICTAYVCELLGCTWKVIIYKSLSGSPGRAEYLLGALKNVELMLLCTCSVRA